MDFIKLNQVLSDPDMARGFRKMTLATGLVLASIFGARQYRSTDKDVSKTDQQELSSEDQKLQERLRDNYEILRPKDNFCKEKRMFIDYSHHNDLRGEKGSSKDNVDYHAMNLSPRLFIAKVSEDEMSEGLYGNKIDHTYGDLKKNIIDRPTGGYMFINRKQNNIQEQCDLYIKNLSLKSGDFRPVIDIEGMMDTKSKKQKALTSFNEASNILYHQYGVYPIIYTSQSNYINVFKGNINPDIPVRVANYNPKGNKRFDPVALPEVDIRQCSQFSKVPIYKKGNTNTTDVNVIIREDRIFMK